MKVEILRSLELSSVEEVMLSMHTFYNVFNVISSELQFLQRVTADDQCLSGGLAACQKIIDSFSDRQCAMESVREMENYQTIILDEVNEALNTHEIDSERERLINSSMRNLNSVFDVADVRVREILARAEAPGVWTAHRIEDLLNDIKQVFQVMADNSRGRYGMVFDGQERGPNDYLVKLSIESPDNERLTMPSVLQDCFRDLLANARKYTLPGGRIEGRLSNTGAGVALMVSDTGRGIPGNEIEDVVAFGVRGSNTHAKESKGGGFGLTKAYYVCRQYKGRMWIESELNQGTTVRMHIP